LSSTIQAVGLDCSDSSTTDCATVLSANQAAIESAVIGAYSRASCTCDEDGANEYAQTCFNSLAEAICNEWDCEACD